MSFKAMLSDDFSYSVSKPGGGRPTVLQENGYFPIKILEPRLEKTRKGTDLNFVFDAQVQDSNSPDHEAMLGVKRMVTGVTESRKPRAKYLIDCLVSAGALPVDKVPAFVKKYADAFESHSVTELNRFLSSRLAGKVAYAWVPHNESENEETGRIYVNSNVAQFVTEEDYNGLADRNFDRKPMTERQRQLLDAGSGSGGSSASGGGSGSGGSTSGESFGSGESTLGDSSVLTESVEDDEFV